MLENIEAIFIDDGGVMQDNETRGQQWLQFLPEYLIPIYGGEAEQWAESNKEVLRQQMPRFINGTGFPDVGGFIEIRAAMAVESVHIMFNHVGIAPPSSDTECFALYQSYNEYVIKRVRSDPPGTVEAIRSLATDGYRLYTASGSESVQIHLMLDVLGVRNLFIETYGPDLVDTHKGSSNYYRLILEHAGENPETALFIDDSLKSVGWIEEAGATAILISKDQQSEKVTPNSVANLAAVPELLRSASG